MIIGKQKVFPLKILSRWKAPQAIVFILLLLLCCLLFQLFSFFYPSAYFVDSYLLTLNIVLMVFLSIVLFFIYRDFIEPFSQLEQLTQAMLAGDLDTKIIARKNSSFIPLSSNINALATMLKAQSTQTEKQINDHVQHITNKTRSLQVLYDVAASVSQSQNINHLLKDYLYTLESLVGSVSSSMQIRTHGHDYKVIAHSGEFELSQHHKILDQCFKNTQFQTKLVWIESINHYLEDDKTHTQYGLICIPLNYRDKFLGSYHLIIHSDKSYYDQADNELLISIGQHLSMAINQNRLRKEGDLVRRIEERSNIANELHDSLAQTIASIRYQTRVLDDSIHQEDEKATWYEMEKLEHSIDEANTELRELIAHFKMPVYSTGFIPEIEQAVERFRHETGKQIFLQKDWPSIKLPAEYEIHILRIIQESLANIRKHADAKTVRILLLGDGVGNFSVLIEDDGIGFKLENPAEGALGEHIGLSIMQERAEHINGSLKVESELEEGTHVMLSFSYQSSNLETN